MDKPNPQQTWQQFWEERDSELDLHGVSYVRLMRRSDGTVAYLYVLRSVDVISIDDLKSDTFGFLITQNDGRRVLVFIDRGSVMVSKSKPKASRSADGF
jgi:phage portal protein BeeE